MELRYFNRSYIVENMKMEIFALKEVNILYFYNIIWHIKYTHSSVCICISFGLLRFISKLSSGALVLTGTTYLTWMPSMNWSSSSLKCLQLTWAEVTFTSTTVNRLSISRRFSSMGEICYKIIINYKCIIHYDG